MESPTVADTVSAVRERRKDLRAVLVDVEACIAAPVPGRADEWHSGVRECLGRLRAAFTDHVATTEAPDGLFDEIRRRSPRLDNATRRLAAEHVAILEQLSTAFAATSRAEPGEVREHVLRLLAMLARHRQHGADLVYEAYTIDIGGSE